MHATPLRVLQVVTRDLIGGTELMVATLVRRLDPERFHAEVALLDAPGRIAGMLRDEGVPTHVLGGRGWPATARRLGALLRRGGYDVVHAYGFKGPLVVRVVAPLAAPRTAVVSGIQGLHPANVDDVDSPLARALLALDVGTSPLVDVYEVNSRGAVDRLAASGVGGGRLRYIPNGIDLDAWPFRNGARPQPPTVLNVSRFAPRKRQRDIVLAAAELRRRGVPARFVLAGDGPTLHEVRALAASLGLEGTVAFPGLVDGPRVRALLAEAEVFCQASLWEGMPAVVLEAMASGVPVVATAVNGTQDLVAHGETGWLVPPRRPDLLAAGLAEALGDGPTRARFARAARERVEAEFALDRVVAQKEALYEALALRRSA